ncbi:MAG: DUF2914 domain-containing protein [Thermoanaerobaculia bacterium]
MSPKNVILLSCTLAIACPITAGEPSALKVSEIKVCREMVDRECRGPATSFKAGTQSVAFFTRVDGATGDGFVEHVWKRDGKEIRRSRLPIKAGSYRAWTTKRIAGMSGAWKVEVLDPVGRSLGQLDFVVEKGKDAADSKPEVPASE